MKKGILYITFGVISLLFVSCNKDKENSQITVQGKIVKDCAGTPYGNQQFTFINPGRALLDERQEVPFTTNADGSFEITCVPGPNSEPSEIRIGDDGGVPILQLDPIADLNIGTLNTAPTANYRFNIVIANNSYLPTDTLIVHENKISYPFKDTILPIVTNHNDPLHISSIKRLNQIKFTPTYVVYSGIRGRAGYVEKKYEYFNTWLNTCTPQVNEINITVE